MRLFKSAIAFAGDTAIMRTTMHLPIRHFLLALFVFTAVACQTHDKVIYSMRSPKNLRVIHPGDTPEIPVDITNPPSANPAAATPTTGAPSAPAAAQ